jgi:2-polyprenyl-3-methyl-5-hydroxy-6-metoxy-1,4-benzoquinol methylase
VTTDSDFRQYYDREWEIKLARPEYATLDARWRSRWDFARKHIPNRSRVLDAACGDSVLGKFLMEEQDCEVQGIDVSPYALELSSKKGVPAKLCNISSESYPYENETFDVVTMLCCLEHILDPVHALTEAHRVVALRGHIVVTLPNAAYLSYRLALLRGTLSKDLLHINPGEGMHIQFFNYTSDFEDRVLSKVPGLRVREKQPDLKNPKQYSPPTRYLMYRLMERTPNLFAQYTHWILEKETR